MMWGTRFWIVLPKAKLSVFVPVMGFAALLVIGFYLFYSYSGNSEDSLEEISDIH